MAGLKAMKLKVIVDPMHGSAAGCISDLFGPAGAGWIEEIRSERNPLFGGNPPEPLAPYLQGVNCSGPRLHRGWNACGRARVRWRWRSHRCR
jgi:hypothetical protein